MGKIKSAIFGGEGLFFATLRGPGSGLAAVAAAQPAGEPDRRRRTGLTGARRRRGGIDARRARRVCSMGTTTSGSPLHDHRFLLTYAAFMTAPHGNRHGQRSPSKPDRGSTRWVPAELPVPPTPTGLGWLGVVGPGVIVLGASIGGGEFLLGPAAFVRYGCRCSGSRAVAVSPDHLQHRGDALHAGDRRAGVHRLHAHAALVDAVGVGLRRPLLPADRLAGMGGERGGRHLLSVRAPAGRCRRTPRRSTSSASATFLAVRRHPVWSGGASSGRSRSSTGCSSSASSAASSSSRWSSCRRATWLAAAAGFVGFDLATGRVRSSPGGRGLRPARRARRRTRAPAASSTSRCRTGRGTRATAWASAPATFPPPSAARR